MQNIRNRLASLVYRQFEFTIDKRVVEIHLGCIVLVGTIIYFVNMDNDNFNLSDDFWNKVQIIGGYNGIIYSFVTKALGNCIISVHVTVKDPLDRVLFKDLR